MKLPYAEPYKIKMVEPIRMSAREQRERWLKQAKYNLFSLKADQVFIAEEPLDPPVLSINFSKIKTSLEGIAASIEWINA